MELDKITKESMKKLATKDSENINDFLIRINEEAEKGKTNLYLSDYQIEKTTKQELERRGFKVDVGGRYNETNTSISWS
jgi:hypothetical protein